MHVDHYIEDTPDVHWPEILQPLNLYTYKNVYDDHIYKQLKNTIVSHLNNHNQVTSAGYKTCLLYTSPSPRDRTRSRMPSSA